MTKKEIIAILEELKATIEELKPIMYESSPKSKELKDKISELYGRIHEYYLDITGNLNIEVPIGGSQLISKHNNFFEAGYLSGRSFHAYQGYTELCKVLGIIKSKDFKSKSIIKKMKRQYSISEKVSIITVVLVLLSGSFGLGYYFGKNSYDLKMFDLTKENDRLGKENNELKSSISIKSDSLNILRQRIIQQDINTTRINQNK